MKRLKLSIIIVSLLIVSRAAVACGPWYTSVRDVDIYRILPYGMEGRDALRAGHFAADNCRLWARQVGIKDTAAVREAVYGGNLAQWEHVYRMLTGGDTASMGVNVNANGFMKNRFVCRLISRRDTDAVRLLYWSKLYESLRNAQRSPWYYNSRLNNSERDGLEQMAAAVQAYRPHRYAERYAFLRLKLEWCRDNDEATLALWQTLRPTLKGTIFHNEAERYVAGCLMNTGHRDEAVRIYVREGDMSSLIQVTHDSLPRLMELLLETAPNSDLMPTELQRMLFILENSEYDLYNKLCSDGYFDVERMLDISQRAMKNPKVKNRAMWGYMAVCLLDYSGRTQEALRMLDEADKAGGADAFLLRSMRAMRFYLRSKTETIDNDFEHYAVGELKWMDRELKREWKRLPKEERYALSHVSSSDSYSFRRSCYMYDAMRRILLEDDNGLCARMLKAGRDVRALQMANMAENRLFILGNNPTVKAQRKQADTAHYSWESGPEHEGFSSYGTASWIDYWVKDPEGYTKMNWNTHDYSNQAFLLADKMSAADLERYYQRVEHPRDAVDRWLNARGYTSADYWHDIIGTHHLRESNYRAAVEQLRHVSLRYQRRLNFRCWLDPFAIDRTTPSHDSTAYKFHFAERMAALEDTMSSARSADSRANAMIEYAIGLQNSFDMCWWLTSYGRSGEAEDFYSSHLKLYNPDGPPMDYFDIEYGEYDAVSSMHCTIAPYKRVATTRAAKLLADAFAMMSSDDVRAKACLRIGHLSTVLGRYRHTPTGEQCALQCDGRAYYQRKDAR